MFITLCEIISSSSPFLFLCYCIQISQWWNPSLWVTHWKTPVPMLREAKGCCSTWAEPGEKDNKQWGLDDIRWRGKENFRNTWQGLEEQLHSSSYSILHFPRVSHFMKQSDGMISITWEAVLKKFDALATAKIVMVGIKLVLPCWKWTKLWCLSDYFWALLFKL